MAPEVREALHRVRRDLQLKDCRNICSRWVAEAGIIGINLDAYMGWGAKGCGARTSGTRRSGTCQRMRLSCGSTWVWNGN